MQAVDKARAIVRAFLLLYILHTRIKMKRRIEKMKKAVGQAAFAPDGEAELAKKYGRGLIITGPGILSVLRMWSRWDQAASADMSVHGSRLLQTVVLSNKKSTRRDSNPRPSPWQGDTPPLSHSCR